MEKPLNSPKSLLNTISDAPVGTGILAFRDLPNDLKNLVYGKESLDFGCGAGRSSRFLKKLGFKVTGVDISEKMLQEAKSRTDGIDYRLIREKNFKNDLPLTHKYDLIFVSFVTMEISSINKLINLFKSLKLFLRREGKMVVISASNNLYHGSWLSIDTNFPENKNPKSGDIVKVYLKDYNLEISDYFWREEDCEFVFENSGLSIVKKSMPLGKLKDGKEWLDEIKNPPFVIYFLEHDQVDCNGKTSD